MEPQPQKELQLVPVMAHPLLTAMVAEIARVQELQLVQIVQLP